MNMRTISTMLVILVFTGFSQLKAQKTFPVEWESKFPIKIKKFEVSEDRSAIFGYNDKEFVVMDGATGEIISKDDIARSEEVKKKYKKEKVSKDDRDKRTSVFRNDQYEIKLSYKAKFDAGSGLSKRNPQPIKVSCSDRSTNTVKWETTIQGFYAHSLCDNVFSSWADVFDMSGDYLWVELAGDKVLVIYEGLTVLDLNTGANLWSVENKNTDLDFKLFALDQQIATGGFPVVNDQLGKLWWTSHNDGFNGVACYDLANGSVVWKSESFKKETIFPHLIENGDYLIVQQGGRILTQRYVSASGSNPEECSQSVKFDDDAGILVLDKNDGSKVWSSSDLEKTWKEKIGDGFADILVIGDQLIATSEKSVLFINIPDGSVQKRISLKEMKVGDTKNIYTFGENLMFHGEEGVALINPYEANLKWSANTKSNYGDFMVGDAYYVYTDVSKYSGRPNAFVRVNMNDGVITGKIDDVPYPHFTDDGNYFFAYDKNSITKYRTK
ncbi:MAG: PQQ-binding-like beta-propeller repeat protein [Bacteroidales bacterium]|nr:PQQ-binding-like beta-propeller repeat protein [Bacteroidales bacterium]